jgi:putative PIN family toxin of toxin-antitoxin system
MQKVVLDTNIIISNAISDKGNPAKIMSLVSDKKLMICYNAEILAEYAEVLSRKRFNFSHVKQKYPIIKIKELGLLIEPAVSNIELPDESDRIFYDTAKAADAYLITGNLKHYPQDQYILLPAQFIEMFGQ